MSSEEFNDYIKEYGDDIFECIEEKFHNKILDNKLQIHKWSIYRKNKNLIPTYSGIYHTISCGYTGIEEHLNEWDAEQRVWRHNSADNREVIMYRPLLKMEIKKVTKNNNK